jgi:hypothetical protein
MARGKLDALSVAAIAFFAANVAHTLDHQRQGTERLTAEIYAGGAVISLLAVVVVVMALRRSEKAPIACAVVGLWTAVGVAASHLAPHWSAFSDPYPDLSRDAFSWAIMLGEIAAAVALGVAGIRALRRAPAGPRAASRLAA